MQQQEKCLRWARERERREEREGERREKIREMPGFVITISKISADLKLLIPGISFLFLSKEKKHLRNLAFVIRIGVCWLLCL